jgi:chorismate mutase
VSRRFEELRKQVAANDRRIVAAVNERLSLVGELWRLKAELGIERVDRRRELELLAELEGSNAGPLSSDGLAQLLNDLLELTKRELENGGEK